MFYFSSTLSEVLSSRTDRTRLNIKRIKPLFNRQLLCFSTSVKSNAGLIAPPASPPRDLHVLNVQRWIIFRAVSLSRLQPTSEHLWSHGSDQTEASVERVWPSPSVLDKTSPSDVLNHEMKDGQKEFPSFIQITAPAIHSFIQLFIQPTSSS